MFMLTLSTTFIRYQKIIAPLCNNKTMKVMNIQILQPLQKQLARTTVRLQTYSRQYETFRVQSLSDNESERQLQLNIAYLYHTSLSILEERITSIQQYITDMEAVIDDLEVVDTSERRHELRSTLQSECIAEVESLQQELQQIDEGIRFARQQCEKLHLGD